MEKNEITVVNQPQDNANHSNLKEWVKPEMVELGVNFTANDIHTTDDGTGTGEISTS